VEESQGCRTVFINKRMVKTTVELNSIFSAQGGELFTSNSFKEKQI